MEPLEHATDIISRRMELRGVVRLAGKSLHSTGRCGPLSTTIHCTASNICRSKKPSSGESNLWVATAIFPASCTVNTSRAAEYNHIISMTHLPRVIDKHVTIGAHTVTHGSILHACLAEDFALRPLSHSMINWKIPMGSDRHTRP